MADSRFGEESFFFLHIDTICRTTAPTCTPSLSIPEAARQMRDQELSGLVVVEGNAPVGILSLRDLRDLMADPPADLQQVTVADIMHRGVISIRRNAYLFEAIFKMAKHRIHRLAVIDPQQGLVGVVNDTDLLSLQARSPLYLSQEMEAAESFEALREINGRILDMLRHATQTGADIRSLIQLIAHFNDNLTQRVISLLESCEGISLPKSAAYLALGSEGRGEQTLRTDQDSAMIFADTLSGEELERCRRFSERMVEVLELVGVPRCPGETMASNSQWRRSVSNWKRVLEEWIAVPNGEHMVNFGMFQDFRTVVGSPEFEQQLHEFIQAATRRNSLFFPYVAKNVVRFPAPIGMFGRIKVERSGTDRGRVNLKKAGIFAITAGISLLALEQNIHQGTTWDKIEALEKARLFSASDAATFSEAFTTLVNLRLQGQLDDIANDRPPGNSIDPMRLTERSRSQLRQALRGVNQLLRVLRDHYRLDLISR
ncbi:MAG: signal transduction protein [Desulfuromonas sp.]|nr:MAG: signal transduction protein [Desulfuromonas sp.]